MTRIGLAVVVTAQLLAAIAPRRRGMSRRVVTWLFDPSSLAGPLPYPAIFFAAAAGVARFIRTSVRRLLSHPDHAQLDRTGIQFLTQLSQALVDLCALVLSAHLVPFLRHLGTALLAGVSIASVVIGLAAQNTLGKVISGFALL